MIADRCTKMILTVIAIALVVIAVRPWIPGAGLPGFAQPDAALAQNEVPKYEVTVPRAWGKFVASPSRS